MHYEIKKVDKNELEQCADVIRQSFGTVASEFGLTVNNCPSNGAFIHMERLIEERDKGNHMYGLYTQRRLVGFVELENKNDGLFYLEKLAVLPDYRHLGFGKALLDYAKYKAKELGAKIIAIGIIEENTVLKDWYLTYGFRHTGTKKYEHLPFTVGFMELMINED